MSQSKTAVVLVHGIGDQKQRGTIKDFTSTLVALGQSPAQNKQQIVEVKEADFPFSYAATSTKIGDENVYVAEMYWADLSKTSVGFLAVLRNFFNLVRDAPDLIYASLDSRILEDTNRDYAALRILRALIAFSLWVIYYPLVAANLAFAILIGGIATCAQLGAHELIQLAPNKIMEQAASTIIMPTAAAGALILAASMAFRLTPYLRMVFSIALLCVTIIFGLCAFNPGAEMRTSDFVQNVGLGITSMWYIPMGVGVIHFAAILVLIPFFWRRTLSLILGFSVHFLILRFWLMLMITLWLVFLTNAFDPHVYKSEQARIVDSIPALAWAWMDVAIVSTLLVISFLIYRSRTRANQLENRSRNYPRLIVPFSVKLATLALTVSSLTLVLPCAMCQIQGACESSICAWLESASTWIVRNAPVLLLVGGVALQFSHAGFEVAADILNYFKSNRGHRHPNPMTAITSAFSSNPQEYREFRPNLQNRLTTMVDDIVKENGKQDRIVFVTHSLGTMIALEALHSQRLNNRHAAKFDIVTMGSPYRSIFRHYFPHQFAPVDRHMPENVGSMLNIYRDNDYVGTTVGERGSRFVEVRQPPLGHLGYFSDKDVVSIIVANIFPAAIGKSG